jgi:hypothetical protein
VREEQETGAFPGPKTQAWPALLEKGSVQLGSGVTIGVATDLLGKLLGIG